MSKPVFSVMFVAALAFAGAAKAADCAPVYAAGTKQAATPYRASVVTSDVTLPPGLSPALSPARITDMVYDGQALYLMIGGKWISRPMTPQMQLAQIAENKKRGHAVCARLADSAVDGEAAAVYTTHDQMPEGTADTKIWISKKTGLPLRSDVRIALHPGGQTTSARFHYGPVKRPPGVK